ncbi:hypothetical protein YWIDRAFT_01034 [Streptomyces sp. SceaMP-e96]|uniref:WXG100 family type VII secretion target n=1 Tax=unclassified Streptomyces TaxID=2593676 RepID=UPI00082389E2|nr:MULTISPECIES: hypothetical protein [unclassified Streptomyces]MYT11813.1 hypothetical protein [Streptomyces sp. SID4951]SCK12283.1 hypothetical protein YWIDRAFT_01034 [Streptomyces sp. SceaMP-e96]
MSDTPATSGTAEYEKKINEKNRKEQIKEEFGSHKVVPKSDSNFHGHGLDALRAMVKNSDPDAIESAGDHWRASADRLAGEDGSGGIRKAFMEAVDHASAHWHGAAADAFRREAQKVLKKIDLTYRHARNVETALIGGRGSGPQGGIAHSLREAKNTMSKIEDAGNVEGFFDTNGKDGADQQFHKDMANPNMDAKMALELNRDNLSLSKERQVEAVIVMEELANNYRLNKPNFSGGDAPPPGPGHDWPTEPREPTHPAPVQMPTPGGPRVKPSQISPHGPNGPSAPFDPSGVNIKPSSPPVRTDLDGVQGGTLTPANPHVPGGGSTGGGGHSGGGGGGGSTGMPGGMMPVMPGKGGGSMGPGGASRGGAMGGRSGASRTGMPGGAGAGRAGMPGGAGAGRPGMPGGGMGGGAGGGAGRGGAAGRSGAQARTPGGMVGKPGAPTGGAKQGGSGLHRSRGGAMAGQGMAGAPGAKGNGKEKERTTGQRPDYLIEDEETWTPQRNVAPRVIE